MRFKSVLLSAAAGLLVAGTAFGADSYKLDTAHSSVGFSVKHMVITNTKGNFKDFSGEILFDPKNVTKSSVKVTIQAASIDTDNADRDKHLRSGDFFDAETHPEITFVSKKVEKKGDGYLLTGTLTLRGVSKEVSFPFTLTGPVQDPWGNTRIGAEASLTINRQDYGVSWNKALDTGGVLVGDNVKIELAVEAVKAK